MLQTIFLIHFFCSNEFQIVCMFFRLIKSVCSVLCGRGNRHTFSRLQTRSCVLTPPHKLNSRPDALLMTSFHPTFMFLVLATCGQNRESSRIEPTIKKKKSNQLTYSCILEFRHELGTVVDTKCSRLNSNSSLMENRSTHSVLGQRRNMRRFFSFALLFTRLYVCSFLLMNQMVFFFASAKIIIAFRQRKTSQFSSISRA